MDTQIINIPEHKQWAVALNQVEFTREFMRRNPHADAIPIRSEWLDMPTPGPGRGMDAFNPEDMEDVKPPKNEHIQNKGESGFYCRGNGCERTFTHQIGRISHERRCQHALNTKIPKNKKK